MRTHQFFKINLLLPHSVSSPYKVPSTHAERTLTKVHLTVTYTILYTIQICGHLFCV